MGHLPLVIVLALAACSVGDGTGQPTDRSSVSADTAATVTGRDTDAAVPSLPPCVPQAAPTSPPEDFPTQIAFPPGSVISSAGTTSAGGPYAEGYAPVGLDDATRFFVESIPAGGFELVLWERETVEADGHFRGHGVVGTWVVVSALDCPEAVYFSVSVFPEE